MRNVVDLCLRLYTQLDIHTVRYVDPAHAANGAAASPLITVFGTAI
jgi:hypothetical protein